MFSQSEMRLQKGFWLHYDVQSSTLWLTDTPCYGWDYYNGMMEVLNKNGAGKIRKRIRPLPSFFPDLPCTAWSNTTVILISCLRSLTISTYVSKVLYFFLYFLPHLLTLFFQRSLLIKELYNRGGLFRWNYLLYDG